MAIEYFGYFGSGFIGGGDQDGAEVVDHCNTTWIYAEHDKPEKAVEQIRRARAHGLKVILSITSIFFHTKWDSPKERELQLRDRIGQCGTYEAICRWNALGAALVNAGVADAIVGLYHMDEPFHNGVHDKFGMAGRLQIVNAFIKSQVPTLPIGCVFAATELLPGHAAEMPPSFGTAFGFDVVGFDCYSDAAPFGDEPHEYEACLARLKAECPGKAIIFVPDGQMFKGDTEDAKRARIEYLYALAQSEPLCVGIFPYTWGSNPPHHVGVRDVPWMRKRYQEIGRAITGKGGQ